MATQPPIVAICIPSQDLVHADFAANLAALCLNPGAKVGIVNCKGSIIPVVRNQCVAAALLFNATHVFFLDSDMVFPLDVLKRLLAHQKEIVGAVYSRRREPLEPTGLPLSGAQVENGLLNMKNMPAGCLLIETDVFSKLAKPWFSDRIDGEQIIGEDIHFSERVLAAGITLWQDVSLSKEVGHIGEKIFKLNA